MKRIILAAIVGGLIVFAWGPISYIVLPFHTMTYNNIPGDDADVVALLEQFEQPGMYHYPGFPHHEDGTPITQEEMDETFERMREGPVISKMIVHPGGKEPFPPQNFILGFLFNIGAALLLALVIAPMRKAGAPFGAGMLIVFCFALFAVITAIIPDWMWYGYPWLVGTLRSLDVMIAWLLAGLAITAIVRPAK